MTQGEANNLNLIMVDVTCIVKLAVALAKVPETVKINHGQCQLLVDRITSLAGHLERMQGEDMQEKLEKSHEVRKNMAPQHEHYFGVTILTNTFFSLSPRSTAAAVFSHCSCVPGTAVVPAKHGTIATNVFVDVKSSRMYEAI